MDKIRILILLISCFFLCQCTKAVSPTESLPAAKPHKLADPYASPVADYLASAKKQEGNEQQNSLILAAGRLISAGKWQQGADILAQTKDLTAVQMNEKKLLLAKTDVLRGRSKAALDRLAQIKDSSTLSAYYQIQYHELLAQSYHSVNNQIQSIFERIKLEHLLTDVESQTNNRRALWLALISLPESELNSLALEGNYESEIQGWLQLALISHHYRDNPKSLLAAIEQWQTHFASHPAHHILPESLGSVANKMLAQPKQVALLLPVSGALAGPGKAIYDGFMAASKSAKGEVAAKVMVYDVDKGDIAEIYQQAISEGANYVVGPLTKSHVAVIAAMDHPVPTLLLNDSDAAVLDNSWLYGLSPASEATQVAIKARNKGYSRALIIAPQNNWGNEVVKVFSQQWQKNDGQIVDTLLYGSNDDLNKRMRDFLRISSSQERGKKLKQLLGDKLQSSTSRRQDFDVIFLLAYPSMARQIMPLLKYYYAGDVPVYATSSVYSGSANALKDKDLDGLIFCDIPWVFSHQMRDANWPEQFNSYNRLYALGMDSYALATQLNQLMLFPADGVNDKNGILYLKSPRQLGRVFEWGQFRQGLAHSLGETG